mmetsp:Transcript_26624/g.34588  ORF Transcript_26624/g.34588 Transcript_26624/m.34588 type:complete len:84 (+) Transcript_26624:498-749(+)
MKLSSDQCLVQCQLYLVCSTQSDSPTNDRCRVYRLRISLVHEPSLEKNDIYANQYKDQSNIVEVQAVLVSLLNRTRNIEHMLE